MFLAAHRLGVVERGEDTCPGQVGSGLQWPGALFFQSVASARVQEELLADVALQKVPVLDPAAPLCVQVDPGSLLVDGY